MLPQALDRRCNLVVTFRDSVPAIAEFRSAIKVYPEMEEMRDNLARVLQKKAASAKEAGDFRPQEAADFKD